MHELKEMVFQQKLLGKAYFIVKVTAAAMVWPASSDVWNAPITYYPTVLGVLLIIQQVSMQTTHTSTSFLFVAEEYLQHSSLVMNVISSDPTGLSFK